MAHGEALRLLKEHAKARRLKGGLVFEKSDEGRAYPYAKPRAYTFQRLGAG
jgi:hypothetical protein